MTNNYHTPHAFGAPLTSDGINAPLATLDRAITNMDVVSVADYGALGDNSTDDTLALQAALNAGAGRTVTLIGTGTYRITDMLTINDVNTRFVGNGATIRQMTNLTTILEVSASYVTVEGIHFYQTSTGTTPAGSTALEYGAGVAVRGSSVYGVTVTKCRFTNCGNPADTGAGVWLSGVAGCVVSDSHFSNCAMSVNTDAWFAGTGGQIIRDNIMVNGTRGYVLDCQGPNIATNAGDVVVGNRISNMSQKGISIEHVINGTVVSGNSVTDCDEEGIVLLGHVENASVNANVVRRNRGGISVYTDGSSAVGNSIANNIVDANAATGIALYVVNGLSITGNQITRNGGQGIQSPAASFANHVQITGNTIDSNATEGIFLGDCAEIIITGNTISRNGTLSAGTYSGLVLGGASDNKNIVIAGNVFSAVYAPSATQKYCYDYTDTFGVLVLLTGNIFGDFVTANTHSNWGGETLLGNVG